MLWVLLPAMYGDQSSILVRLCGQNYEVEQEQFYGTDILGIVEFSVACYSVSAIKPLAIIVNTAGIGAAVYDLMKRKGLPVREMHKV